MVWYSRSDYGSDPHAGANRNNAAQRGWGSGWPNCQSSKQVRVSVAGVVVYVRREIATLVGTLMSNTEKRYGYNILSGQTWGYACRAIRGTSTASNHSWGLAVDINSLSNPMQSTFKSNIPPAVVKMWEACGFYWGGRYRNRPDAMHFEYIFSPSDVSRHLSRARSYGDDDMPLNSDDKKWIRDAIKEGVRENLARGSGWPYITPLVDNTLPESWSRRAHRLLGYAAMAVSPKGRERIANSVAQRRNGISGETVAFEGRRTKEIVLEIKAAVTALAQLVGDDEQKILAAIAAAHETEVEQPSPVEDEEDVPDEEEAPDPDNV